MAIDGDVHVLAVLADGSLHGDYGEWLVSGVLLQARHLAREAVLLAHDTVEVADGGQLAGGDIAEVGPGAVAVEEAGELVEKVGAGGGVEEADGEGEAAAAEPDVGVLEGGDPDGAEERRGIEPGELGPGSGVVLEMLDRLLG